MLSITLVHLGYIDADHANTRSCFWRLFEEMKDTVLLSYCVVLCHTSCTRALSGSLISVTFDQGVWWSPFGQVVPWRAQRIAMPFRVLLCDSKTNGEGRVLLSDKKEKVRKQPNRRCQLFGKWFWSLESLFATRLCHILRGSTTKLEFSNRYQYQWQRQGLWSGHVGGFQSPAWRDIQRKGRCREISLVLTVVSQQSEIALDFLLSVVEVLFWLSGVSSMSSSRFDDSMTGNPQKIVLYLQSKRSKWCSPGFCTENIRA